MIPESVSIIPVPVSVEDICDRYLVDIRSGIVYDRTTNDAVAPQTESDGRIVYTLGDSTSISVEDLLIRTIYGSIGAGSQELLTGVPSDTSLIVPRMTSFRRKSDTELTINDRVYVRWKSSQYYVSKQGAIFNDRTGQWCRRIYDEKRAAHVIIRGTTGNYHQRVQRIVWETFRGPLTINDTVNPRNGRMWDCRLENIEIVSRVERRALTDPKKYHIFSEETIRSLREDLLSDMSNRNIAERHDIGIDYVWKLRTGRTVPSGFEGVAEMSSKRHRDKPLSDDTVRQIRDMRESGVSVRDISKTTGVGVASIYQILQGRTYTDVK